MEKEGFLFPFIRRVPREDREDNVRCKREAEFLRGELEDEGAAELRRFYRKRGWNEADLPFFTLELPDSEVPGEVVEAMLHDHNEGN